VRDLPRARAFPGHPRRSLFCWTVRSERDRLRATQAGAQIIFEERG
jgi:hypothetical protein